MIALVICLILVWLNCSIAQAINNDQMYNPFPVNVAIVIGYLIYLVL